MRKILAIALAALLAAAFYMLPGLYVRWRWSGDKEMCVFLAYGQKGLEGAAFIAEAYESVLQEEGVPHRRVDAEELVELNASGIAARVPAIIFPEYILQVAPDGLASWVGDYLAAGGNVLAVYDVGISNEKGVLKERPHWPR